MNAQYIPKQVTLVSFTFCTGNSLVWTSNSVGSFDVAKDLWVRTKKVGVGLKNNNSSRALPRKRK